MVIRILLACASIVLAIVMIDFFNRIDNRATRKDHTGRTKRKAACREKDS